MNEYLDTRLIYCIFPWETVSDDSYIAIYIEACISFIFYMKPMLLDDTGMINSIVIHKSKLRWLKFLLDMNISYFNGYGT